nr:phosphodiester glycosidase family protein [Parvularcula dongshanensis]
MNAGMYHRDRSPVGLFVSGGAEVAPLNREEAEEGNFFLLPNGVFWVDEEGAHVATTDEYASEPRTPRLATQSGPMLLIAGAPHPRFLPKSTSLHIRNGIAVEEGGVVVAVISDRPVNFHRFAAFFRERLGVTDALYLDGTISRLNAPSLNRSDPGARMGPILVAVPREEDPVTP